jgi:hypothetical protein
MMIETGVFISGRTLAGLPEGLRRQIMDAVASDGTAQGPGEGRRGRFAPVPAKVVALGAVEAQRLVGGLGEQAVRVLRGIAATAAEREGESGAIFEMADLAGEVGCRPSELGGVWSGVTRRLRNVTGDREGVLVDWCGAPLYEGRVYVGQTARVRVETLDALREALKPVGVAR